MLYWSFVELIVNGKKWAKNRNGYACAIRNEERESTIKKRYLINKSFWSFIVRLTMNR